MTGLKSGSGDDLWDDDADEDEENSADDEQSTEEGEQTEEPSSTTTMEAIAESIPTTTARDSSDQEQSYLVRRAVQDKSVQFERDERLTFFVHDDVVNGERDLITEVESALGRDVPKFDVREAVYRAALQNRDDILEELVKMGYSLNRE